MQATLPSPRCELHLGDNLRILEEIETSTVRLVYVDPPFNTGQQQKKKTLSTVRDEGGDRAGFGGRRYRSEVVSQHSYRDAFDDYLAFLEPRLLELWRVLTPDGSLFVHLDHREVHYVKVLLDRLVGREKFRNEIIWAYDYGGRPKNRWPTKHDTLLWYVKDPKRYVFQYDEIDRIPYMAPSLVGEEKAKRGKTPTDVWWHTIVPTNSREKTGYPTQKPLGILQRIVRVHSLPGDTVLDAFCGSGTTGEAALRNGRSCILIDENPEAIRIAGERLGAWDPEVRTARR